MNTVPWSTLGRCREDRRRLDLEGMEGQWVTKKASRSNPTTAARHPLRQKMSESFSFLFLMLVLPSDVVEKEE
jgi:hypothetical protein